MLGGDFLHLLDFTVYRLRGEGRYLLFWNLNPFKAFPIQTDIFKSIISISFQWLRRPSTKVLYLPAYQQIEFAALRRKKESAKLHT